MITFKEFPGCQINLGWLYDRIQEAKEDVDRMFSKYEEIKDEYNKTNLIIVGLRCSLRYALKDYKQGHFYNKTMSHAEHKCYDELKRLEKPVDDLYLNLLRKRIILHSDTYVAKQLYKQFFMRFQRMQTLYNIVHKALGVRTGSLNNTWDIPLKYLEYSDKYKYPELHTWKKRGYHGIIMDEENNEYFV